MLVRLRSGVRFVPHGAPGFADLGLWTRLVRLGEAVDISDEIYRQYSEYLLPAEELAKPKKGQKAKAEEGPVEE